MNNSFKTQFKPVMILLGLYLPISFLVDGGSYGMNVGAFLLFFMTISFLLFIISLFIESLRKYMWGFLLSIPLLFLLGLSICTYRNII